MKGMVYVEAEAVAADEKLREWVEVRWGLWGVAGELALRFGLGRRVE
jgi:hypothetical protein